MQQFDKKKMFHSSEAKETFSDLSSLSLLLYEAAERTVTGALLSRATQQGNSLVMSGTSRGSILQVKSSIVQYKQQRDSPM